MLTKDLKKHAGEFLRYMRGNNYEHTDTGILFPKAQAMISGVYIHDVNGEDEKEDTNMLPDEGLMYLLTCGLYNGSKLPNWYLALYAANYTPTAALTAASFPATASEITSATEGYTEALRPTWVPSPPAANSVDNVANKVSYTIATSLTLTVNGAALLSDATRGAVTGKLISAAKFDSPRDMHNNDVFNLAYRVGLTSV